MLLDDAENTIASMQVLDVTIELLFFPVDEVEVWNHRPWSSGYERQHIWVH